MTDILGVILAGGLARRMGGGDKGLVQVGGHSLLDHVIDRLGPQVGAMALNANGDPARFAPFNLPVLPDTEPDFPGPLAGVLAGMDWAVQHGAQRIVTVAADTPFFPRDLVARLASGGDGVVLAATRDADKGLLRHPTFGLWPVALRDDLRAALRQGTRKIVAWTDHHNGQMVEFPVGFYDPFFNINRPEDKQRAEEIMERLRA